MVFFTCNHCGESLKKKAVEKHYEWKSCKTLPIFLTCVDCCKDFKLNEYKEHIKCISEAEKYSAKGYVAKPESNKGAQKQEAWTEVIRELIANNTDVDASSRDILIKIVEQTNVPRKKQKFMNFLKNSMKVSLNNVGKIWAIIEKGLDEFRQKTAPPENESKKRKISEGNNDETEMVDKKKKKGNGALVKEDIPTTKAVDNDETAKKSKKNKIIKSEQKQIDVQEDEPIPNLVASITKKKNKKNKRLAQDIADDDTGEQPSPKKNFVELPIKNKKKKKQQSAVLDATDEQHSIGNGVSRPVKTNKKDKKAAAVSHDTNNGTNGNEVSETNGKLKTTCNLFHMAMQLLGKKSEMKCAMLKSKLLAGYKKTTGSDVKFEKKYKNCMQYAEKKQAFIINNDIVKLNK